MSHLHLQCGASVARAIACPDDFTGSRSNPRLALGDCFALRARSDIIIDLPAFQKTLWVTF
jgi:hypothetical protein